jgi:hypothetical protein
MLCTCMHSYCIYSAVDPDSVDSFLSFFPRSGSGFDIKSVQFFANSNLKVVLFVVDNFYTMSLAVMWIRILTDPHSFWSAGSGSALRIKVRIRIMVAILNDNLYYDWDNFLNFVDCTLNLLFPVFLFLMFFVLFSFFLFGVFFLAFRFLFLFRLGFFVGFGSVRVFFVRGVFTLSFSFS